MNSEDQGAMHSIWIELPGERPDSFNYVLGIIEDRCGISGFSIRPADGSFIRIGSDVSRLVYEFPCDFLTTPESAWLKSSSMPQGRLEFLDCSGLFPTFREFKNLPVFMRGKAIEINISNDLIQIPVDIFGTIFFMLTRYEEYVNQARDSIGRFSMACSTLRDKDIYSYPIVDLYLILIAQIFSQLESDISIKRNVPTIAVSCDVDHPFLYGGNFKTKIKRLAGDVLRRRSFRAATLTALSFFKNMDDVDCYLKSIKFIIEVNRKLGNSVTFFFIPNSTHPNDNNNTVTNSKIKNLMRLIIENGYKVGVHPGFLTSTNATLMCSAINDFKNIFLKISSGGNKIYSRQHYLMWDVDQTPRLLAQNDVNVDCTLGFNDRPGFRAGTCHKFPLFDPKSQRMIGLIEMPLIAMEWSLLSPNYMGIEDMDAAKEMLLKLKQRCFSVEGCFSILWHNNHLLTENHKKLYEDIIAPFNQGNFSL